MTHLPVSDELIEEIRLEAEAEGVTIEAVLLAAWRHYRTLAQQKKVEAELEWWKRQAAEVQVPYAGEHVAVHHQAVVDHDPDPVALHERVRQRFGKEAVLLIPAEGPRDIRLVSFRAERA